MGTRDSSGWAAGAGRAAPLQTVAAPAVAHLFRGGAWDRPKGARSQPGERSLKGAWMNWTQARQPRAAGSPKARLAAKEETRQAALALLASVNAPGPTRSDFTYSLESQQG